MKTKIIIACISIVIFLFLLPEPEINKLESKTGEQITNQIPSGSFIIRSARVYDGEKLFEDVDFLVKNNKVHSISKNIKLSEKTDLEGIPEIDGRNKTILPGLVDAHTHAYGTALNDAINFGVTTELDMFTMPEFANQHQTKRDEQSNHNAADLFSATILATTKGGHGTEYGFDIPTLDNPKQVEQFVKDRISQGADYIKAVYNAKESKLQHFPSISYEVLAELIIQAHKHNLLLVVHVDNLLSAHHAIELGADGIVHSFMDKIVDDQFIELMIKKNAFIIPTLLVQAALTQQTDGEEFSKQPSIQRYLNQIQKQQLKSKFPNFNIPKQGFQNALTSVNKLAQSGVSVLAGTDAPNPGTTHGASLHRELFFLVKAGLSNEEAIHAATGAARKYFLIGNRGTLKPNAPATLILIDGNPFDDISESLKILHIWKHGQWVKRKNATASNSNIEIKPHIIADFNKATNVKPADIGIVKSSDQVAGGESTVLLDLKTNPEGNQYLNVSGELKKKFMFPWSGIAHLPTKSMQKGADFSQLQVLSFSAKTNIQSSSGRLDLSVLLFLQGSFQPLEQTVTLTNEWREYHIELEKFGQSNLSNVVNISIVVNKRLGSFDFSIDDINVQ
ncbi:MAG: amidohydrolase family protein [Kangiellaceae bacterium]